MNSLNISMVYSILKCEFGWNGVQPETLQQEEIESALMGQGCEIACANKLAILLDEHGATFRGRIDGRPNIRHVRDGVVYLRVG